MYYKIKNLIQPNGNADYKGLNVNLFIPGKQVYDLQSNECAVETTEELFEHEDVQQITIEEYFAFKDRAEDKEQSNLYDEVQILKAENAELREYIDEHEAALIEVVNMIIGGDE